jgi:hypothetical protein
MITMTLFSAARTALVNANGRDLPIVMLASIDAFIFGVVKDTPQNRLIKPGGIHDTRPERYVPFSMRSTGGAAVMWDDRGDNDPTQAMQEIADLIGCIARDGRVDPHP